MADIDRLIGFMAIMQVPFMNDPDALAYIEEVKTVLKQAKAQQPRVMTLNEMNDKRGRGEAVYYEDRDATCNSQDVFVIAPDKDFDIVWLKAETYTLATKMSAMGKTWRCWTAKPTDEQREAVKWDE